MRISFEIDTDYLKCAEDIAALQKIFESWAAMLAQPKPVKADPKEEKAALENVKEILKEPVAPVQQKKAKAKWPKSGNIKPDPAKKSQKCETKSQESKTKKAWSPKQKADIKAIRDAYEQQKKDKEKQTRGGPNNIRKDIDNTLIVYMRDEQHKSLKEIARELRCCEQTVLNRYNREKMKGR